MKILIVTSSYQKTETDKFTDFMYNMAQEFRRKGHEVLVVAAHYPGLPKRDMLKEIPVERFKYFIPSRFEKLAYDSGMAANMRKSHLAKLQLPLYMVSGTLAVMRAAGKFRPDVVHSLWVFPQGLMCAIAKKFCKFPLVINAIGTEAYLAKKMKMGSMIRFAANTADAVTATSSATANAVKSCGYNKDIQIIFNGADDALFNPNNSGETIIKEHSLQNKKILLCIGRFNEMKGQRYLIEAMPEVLKKFPETSLLLIGEGPLKEELQSYAKAQNLQSSIIFLGNKAHEELAKYYAACDVFIIPSIVDSHGVAEGGQGLVTKEAMLTGKCVIGADTGGIPDLVINNETGLLVEQKSAGQLSDAIIKLLGDDALRARLAQAGHKMAKEKAAWGGICAEYEEIYKRIIKR
ncbi:MAG: glycosyltransferase family 4 protein [Candidatus Diapherotrites archaeon]|nr:glycosyltransferase family 4 protein [Candidatus Diapherotrites archaeon]